MRLTISKSKNAEQLYITKAFRVNKHKTTSKIVKKLGSMESLLPQFDNDRESVIAWAKEEAKKMTEEEKKNELKIPVELSETKQIALDERNSFHGGYLFLQKLFYETGLQKICRKIDVKYDYQYKLADILSGLIYARILSPSSKRSSFSYLKELLEEPTFSQHDIYRALDILYRESDFIQAEVYKASAKTRNTSVLYYDCTNYFFEIEEDDELRKYGKSKEHRPNPIVQMGLFLDGNGIPLAFTIFPGNKNEQPTLIPLEKQIIKDFQLSQFIICTDAGLASLANRRFNDRQNRSFVVTQSLKVLPSHLQEWALSPEGWSLEGDDTLYDLSKIDDEMYLKCVFHKERWIHENDFGQRLIVSYSPKYKQYEREVRERQIQRAKKLVEKGTLTKNLNSPKRFIEEIQMTLDGVIADQKVSSLNEEKIAEEEKYDGFTAVCTTLTDDVSEILKINRRRWEIEESFRIMKSEFKARPVYLQKSERIQAHFLTCFLSLLIFRLLEQKLSEAYTADELISTLKTMDFQRLKGIGYIPSYTRTEITDSLHKCSGFRTDSELITDKKMKEIFKATKK